MSPEEQKRLRVLYIHHGSGSGGAPNALLRLIQNLDRSRIEPIVACRFSIPSAKSFFASHGLEPIDMPTASLAHTAKWLPLHNPRCFAIMAHWCLLKHPKSKRCLKRIFFEHKPDIVHLNSLTLAPLAPMLHKMGVRVILHVREPVSKGTLGFRRHWLRYVSNKYCDHIIYICHDNQDRLTGKTQHSTVLYDPVSLEQFNEHIDGRSIRSELGLPQDAIVLFFPGGSSLGIKGIFPFLEALNILRQENISIYAIIPGIENPNMPHNKERQRIETSISRLQLERSIIRAPFSTNVERYYAASDIVVVPFTTAHFSLGALEAGAMKKPVVGSNMGGIEEVVSNNNTGLLVIPNDERDLAAKLKQLVNDHDLRNRMGNNGLIQTRKLCEAQKYAERVMKIYQNDRVLA